MDAKDGVGDGEPKRGGSAIAALLFVLIVLLVLLVDVLLVVLQGRTGGSVTARNGEKSIYLVNLDTI